MECGTRGCCEIKGTSKKRWLIQGHPPHKQGEYSSATGSGASRLRADRRTGSKACAHRKRIRLMCGCLGEDMYPSSRVAIVGRVPGRSISLGTPCQVPCKQGREGNSQTENEGTPSFSNFILHYACVLPLGWLNAVTAFTTEREAAISKKCAPPSPPPPPPRPKKAAPKTEGGFSWACQNPTPIVENLRANHWAPPPPYQNLGPTPLTKLKMLLRTASKHILSLGVGLVGRPSKDLLGRAFGFLLRRKRPASHAAICIWRGTPRAESARFQMNPAAPCCNPARAQSSGSLYIYIYVCIYIYMCV